MSSNPSPLPSPRAGVPTSYEPPSAGAAPRGDRIEGRQVVLCVTGSIAAYKAALVLRLLQAKGAEVDVVLSAGAQRFVTAQTFSALTGRPTYTEMFEADGGERHVALAAAAHAVVIAPATADVMTRIEHGRASNLVTALVLCSECPVLVAPAMHPRMWKNPITQRTVESLRSHGRFFVMPPEHGKVASGDVGEGRMPEPEAVVDELARLLTPSPLALRHVIVTAGPTVEALDPVRYLGNRSSGKMGFSIAERAAQRGARVTLIAGPSACKTPRGVTRRDVGTALEMRAALREAAGEDLALADAVIMAAAVADYRPAEPSADKLERDGERLTLELVENPDILAELGEARTSRAPVLIGFALETAAGQELIARARKKLAKKKVDLIVANRASEALGGDDTQALLVGVQDCTDPGAMSKQALSDEILDWLGRRLQQLDWAEVSE